MVKMLKMRFVIKTGLLSPLLKKLIKNMKMLTTICNIQIVMTKPK